MKKYKEFINELINPKLVFKSKDEELAAVQKQLDDIDNTEKMFKDYADQWEELRDDIFDQIKERFPKLAADTMILSLRFIEDDECRMKYKKLLNLYKSKLLSGIDLSLIVDDPIMKIKREEIEDLMAIKLDIDKEELKEMTKKFFGGIEKYNKNKEKEKIIAGEIDPYGEENWSDKTEEERWKEAFPD